MAAFPDSSASDHVRIRRCVAAQWDDEVVLRDPPNGAEVRLDPEKTANGWNSPAMAPWLGQVIDVASRAFYGKPAMHMGEGGSIPFMGLCRETRVASPVAS